MIDERTPPPKTPIPPTTSVPFPELAKDVEAQIRRLEERIIELTLQNERIAEKLKAGSDLYLAALHARNRDLIDRMKALARTFRDEDWETF